MAIQNRRGVYGKLNTGKLLPGEYAIVLNDDPNCKDGKAAYICFKAGDVKRLSTYEDMVENIENATDDVSEAFTEDVRVATEEAHDKAAYANAQGDYAKTQGDYSQLQGGVALSQGNHAKTQGDYAKSQGDRSYNVLESCTANTAMCKNATSESIKQTGECEEVTKKALEAITGHSIIYDPSDGNKKTVQDTINNMWIEIVKKLCSPITIMEFDALQLTISQFDEEHITVNAFDTNGKTILLNQA